MVALPLKGSVVLQLASVLPPATVLLTSNSNATMLATMLQLDGMLFVDKGRNVTLVVCRPRVAG